MVKNCVGVEMKQILIIMFLVATYLYADDIVRKPTEGGIDLNGTVKTNSGFIGKPDTKMLLAKKMLDVLKRNVALKQVNIKSAVVFQGQERNYPRPFYKITNDYILLALKQLNNFDVRLNEQKPRLQIIGTPTSLKISKVTDQKMDELAQFYNADAIFVWDMFKFEGKMVLLAKIIKTSTHELLWTLQVDENQIETAEAMKKEFKRQYKIPKNSYISLSAGTLYSKHTYTKKSSTKTEVTNNHWLADMDFEYITTSSVDPQLNFGVLYNYQSFVISDYPESYHSVMVDFRYQLNDYVEPIYDLESGKVFIDRNRALYSVGVSFGPTLVRSTDAKKNKTSGTMKVYFHSGITEKMEYKVGVQFRANDNLAMKDNGDFTKNTLETSVLSFYMSVGYKFSIEKE